MHSTPGDSQEAPVYRVSARLGGCCSERALQPGTHAPRARNGRTTGQAHRAGGAPCGLNLC